MCKYQRNVGRIDEHEFQPRADDPSNGNINLSYEEDLANLTPELDPTRAIMKDIEDLAVALGPLEVRHLPDLTHGLATWNVCNGFEAETIATLMLKCSLSILCIQEPRMEFKNVEVAYSRKKLLEYGINGYFSRYQYILYNERALNARVANFQCQMEGRLISCDIQIGPAQENTFLRLFS